VQDEVGYALFLAQRGEKHIAAKPMKGPGGGVLEVVADHRGDTFRVVLHRLASSTSQSVERRNFIARFGRPEDIR
jgi:phage-related protein